MGHRLYYRIAEARSGDVLGTVAAIIQWNRLTDRTFIIPEAPRIRAAVLTARPKLPAADVRGLVAILDRGTATSLDLLFILRLLDGRRDVLDAAGLDAIRFGLQLAHPETGETTRATLTIPVASHSVTWEGVSVRPERAIVLSIETETPVALEVSLGSMATEMGPRVARSRLVYRDRTETAEPALSAA